MKQRVNSSINFCWIRGASVTQTLASTLSLKIVDFCFLVATQLWNSFELWSPFASQSLQASFPQNHWLKSMSCSYCLTRQKCQELRWLLFGFSRNLFSTYCCFALLASISLRKLPNTCLLQHLSSFLIALSFLVTWNIWEPKVWILNFVLINSFTLSYWTNEGDTWTVTFYFYG